jgi:hypothetical protein
MLLKRITLTPIPAITKINKTQARKLLKSGKYRDLFMPFILPNVKVTHPLPGAIFNEVVKG